MQTTTSLIPYLFVSVTADRLAEELASRKCNTRSSIVNAITFPWTKLASDMVVLETFPFHQGKVIAEKEDPSAYIFILSFLLSGFVAGNKCLVAAEAGLQGTTTVAKLWEKPKVDLCSAQSTSCSDFGASGSRVLHPGTGHAVGKGMAHTRYLAGESHADGFAQIPCTPTLPCPYCLGRRCAGGLPIPPHHPARPVGTGFEWGNTRALGNEQEPACGTSFNNS